MKILVLDGDGIGPEIASATVRAVNALNHRLNLGLEITHADSGLTSLEKHGVTFFLGQIGPRILFHKPSLFLPLGSIL